jgi:hypothetical protein
MTRSEFAPRKAEKKRVKLKMAVQGPSGSGKTWGALALAKNLWPDAKICVVDTENESASLYADSFAFDTIPLGPPFTTARYVQCIDAVSTAGYDVIILDSITPQWDGEGGILRRKEEMDRRPGSNGYANWATFTPEHEAFKQTMMQTPMHLIATMRSKQDYILVANDKGKQVPKKVGMAPIQRDQIDYEFTLVFDVEMDHKGAVSKDRTGLFNEKVVDLANPATAEAIRGWLEHGKEVLPDAQRRAPEAQAQAQGAISHPQNASRPTSTQESAQRATQALATALAAEQPQVGQLKFIPPNGLTAVIKGVKEIEALPAKPANGDIPAMKGVRGRLVVTLLGQHKGVSEASCFNMKLWPALKESVGLECHFQIAEKDSNGKHYLNIEDLIYVSGEEFVNGQPVGIGGAQ